MREIKPPQPYDRQPDEPSIFVAGSIEMGAAEDWQRVVAISMAEEPNIVLLNPRRDDWDSSWRQSIDHSEFRGQVEWELYCLETADAILLYFDPATKSPIALLELGLYARSGKLVVCCPEGFWRRGNVEVVCWKYDVLLVDRLAAAVSHAIDIAFGRR